MSAHAQLLLSCLSTFLPTSRVQLCECIGRASVPPQTSSGPFQPPRCLLLCVGSDRGFVPLRLLPWPGLDDAAPAVGRARAKVAQSISARLSRLFLFWQPKIALLCLHSWHTWLHWRRLASWLAGLVACLRYATAGVHIQESFP